MAQVCEGIYLFMFMKIIIKKGMRHDSMLCCDELGQKNKMIKNE